MDSRILNLLEINQTYNATIRENEISLLDILLNEVGGTISGRSRPIRLRTIQRVWLRLKQMLKPKIELNIIDEAKTANVIILVTEPTHLRQTIPVYAKLFPKIKLCFITNKYSLYDQLKSENIPVYYFNTFEKISSSINSFSISIPQDVAILSNKIRDLFFIRRPAIESCLKYFEAVLSTSHLKGVIVGNDTTFHGRLLVSLSRKKGLKTFSIQHGLIADDWLNKIHIVDYYFLFGLISKNKLLHAGLNEEQLIVTGAPYLDLKRTNLIGKVLKELNLSKKYILILLSGYGHGTSEKHYNLILDNLFRLIRAFPNQLFLVKPHRKEKISDYKKRINGAKNLVIIENDTYDFTIFDWICDADFVITGHSSTALEALYMNRPVISVDFLSEYQNIEFISKQAVIVTKEYNQLVEVVKNIKPYYERTIESRNKLLSQYFHSDIQSASNKIANFIYSGI